MNLKCSNNILKNHLFGYYHSPAFPNTQYVENNCFKYIDVHVYVWQKVNLRIGHISFLTSVGLILKIVSEEMNYTLIFSVITIL